MFTICYVLLAVLSFTHLSLTVAAKKEKKVVNEFIPGFIIRLHDSKSHGDFYEALSKFLNVSEHQLHSIMDIKYEYHDVYHGLYIAPTSLLTLEILQDKIFNKFISNAQFDTQMSLFKYSWGLDRIDQFSLPLDGVYYPTYTGLGVDVYVLDTGLDTLHVEFQGNSKRIVKNIFDVDVTDPSMIAANNDDNGHGTHCAGTVGGNTVGVARDANIYGVKVIDSMGRGSGVVAGLDFVYQYAKKNSNNPAVISMSLGSYCSDQCSTVPTLIAVQNITNRGFFTVVAAGNEACDACRTSPAAAYNTITVGATDENDNIAKFSNYGECVDIFAPGVNISSAESSLINGNEFAYFEKSGTSQATPHVAGVVAQQLQRLKSISSPSELSKILSCESSKNKIQLGILDTISRNYLLQIPRINNVNDTCNLVNGCSNLNFCSKHGICQKANPVSVYGNLYNPNTAKDTCHCDKLYYGDDCSSTVNPAKNCSASFSESIVLMGKYPNWGDSSFAVYNRSTGFIYNNVYSSSCNDQSYADALSFCFEPGEYTLQTNVLTDSIYWEFCNSTGGTPSTFEFNIDKNGNCNHVCTNGIIETISIVPVQYYYYYQESFDVKYLIRNLPAYEIIYSSPLSIEGSPNIDNICLKTGNYSFIYNPLSYNVVNLKFCNNNILKINVQYFFEIDAKLNCRILPSIPLPPSPTLFPTIASSFKPTSINTIAISVVQTIKGCLASDYNDDRSSSDNALIYSILRCYNFPIYSSSVNDITLYDIVNPRNSFNVSYSVSIANNISVLASELKSQLSNCISSGTFNKNFLSYVEINGPDILLNANSLVANIVIIQDSSISTTSNSTNKKSSKLKASSIAAIVIVVVFVTLLIAFIVYKKYYQKSVIQSNELNTSLLSSFQ